VVLHSHIVGVVGSVQASVLLFPQLSFRPMTYLLIAILLLLRRRPLLVTAVVWWLW
jgi:hypothetical protein